MKSQIELALGIIAGTISAFDHWNDFCDGNCRDKVPRDEHNQSLFEWKRKVEHIVKKEAVKCLSKTLERASMLKDPEEMW